MISDVLSEAVVKIDAYLEAGAYEGELRARVIAVRDHMDAVRNELDAGPPIGPSATTGADDAREAV